MKAARWWSWAAAPGLFKRLGGEVRLRRAGKVRWAADPEEGRRLTALATGSRERGYPVRPVDRDELARLLPEARIGPVAAASFAPTTGRWSRRWCWTPAAGSWPRPGC